MKILHVFGCMDRGGAELRTVEWMKGIDRCNYQFHFCCLSGRRGALDEEIESLGGKVFYIDRRDRFGQRFLQLLAEEKYDVVHSHVYYFSGYVLQLAFREKVSIRIAHFRSSASYRKLSLYRRLYQKIAKYMIKKYATHICAVCRGALDSIWHQNEQDHRFSVIYNGFVDDLPPRDSSYIRREFNIKETAKIVIHVGSLRIEKNHERIIQIFAAMCKRHSDLVLLIVGKKDRAIFEKLQRLVAENNLYQRVIFTDVRKDVLSLLGSSDLLLFPSLQEGLPGVVIESSLMLTNVLASDVGGVPEVAQFFPNLVTVLSLQNENDFWCEKALQLIEKENIHEPVALSDTPFYLPKSLENILTIYHSGEKI